MDIPFSFLEVSNSCWTLHVMSTTLRRRNTGGICALSTPHTRQFDRVVVVTCAFVVGDFRVILLEIFLELRGPDDIRIAVIQPWIPFFC